jgi:hypothetical protein
VWAEADLPSSIKLEPRGRNSGGKFRTGYDAHSGARRLHQLRLAITCIKLADGSSGLLSPERQRAGDNECSNCSKFSFARRLGGYKIQIRYSSIDEVVVFNGDRDALTMVSIFHAQNVARATNADRLSQRDLVRQGHDKLNRDAFSEFTVDVHEHTARAYITALRGGFGYGVSRVSDGNRQLEKKTPGGTLLRLRLRHFRASMKCD